MYAKQRIKKLKKRQRKKKKKSIFIALKILLPHWGKKSGSRKKGSDYVDMQLSYPPSKKNRFRKDP